jgi:hypothetical protein
LRVSRQHRQHKDGDELHSALSANRSHILKKMGPVA